MTQKSSTPLFDPRSAISRIHLRDSLVHQETASLFISNLSSFSSVKPGEIEALTAQAELELYATYGYDRADVEERKPFVYQGGIAVVPIHGTLLNRCAYSWGFVTGYQFLYRQIEAIEQDDDVELVVFDVDSPGGEAAGCFELGKRVQAMKKPTLAMIDSMAASGGYALPAACDRMVAIPSARIGSIGVYRMHIDLSKAMEDAGVKFTFVQAGEHKTDGNPFEPLSREVQADWQKSVNKTWDDFTGYVAEARGMSQDEVRATQARVYRADEALALGLIDEVNTPSEAVAAFLAELAGDTVFNGDEEMSDPKKPEATSAPAIDQNAINAAVANAIAADRQRTASILNCEEAKGKTALAQHLAAATSLSVEEAKGVLNASVAEAKGADYDKGKKKPKSKMSADPGDEDEDADDDDTDEDDAEDEDGAEAARAARGKRSGDKTNHFERAMGKSKHPNVGAGSERSERNGGAPTDEDMTSSILGDYSRASGFKVPNSAKH